VLRSTPFLADPSLPLPPLWLLVLWPEG